MLFGKSKKSEFVLPGKFTRIYIPKPKIRRDRKDSPRLKSARGPFITKRRKFVLVSLALSAGLFAIQAVSVERRYLAILILSLVSYSLSAWAMIRDLRGIQWVTNLVLPTFYPAAIALFYFLLPQAMVVRIGVNIIFAVSMYALLLTSNIYAVASIRTIQLLRAARAVGFLLSVLTSAFMYQVLFALRLPGWQLGISVFVVSFLIFLQGVWTHTLSIKGGNKEMRYALVGSMLILEVSMALSYWLVDVALAAIMLAMMMYVLLGIFQQDLEQRLFKRTIQEYVGFATIVFVVVVISVFYKWMS